MKKRLKIKDIPLKGIIIGKEQLLSQISDEEIKDLVARISETGIIKPISVCPSDEGGKYVLLTGLRYFLAYKKLNKKTIKAVVTHKLNETEIKQVNLTESLQGQELSIQDYERIEKSKWNLLSIL